MADNNVREMLEKMKQEQQTSFGIPSPRTTLISDEVERIMAEDEEAKKKAAAKAAAEAMAPPEAEGGPVPPPAEVIPPPHEGFSGTKKKK